MMGQTNLKYKVHLTFAQLQWKKIICVETGPVIAEILIITQLKITTFWHFFFFFLTNSTTEFLPALHHSYEILAFIKRYDATWTQNIEKQNLCVAGLVWTDPPVTLAFIVASHSCLCCMKIVSRYIVVTVGDGIVDNAVVIFFLFLFVCMFICFESQRFLSNFVHR